jgi:hypothetical protein
VISPDDDVGPREELGPSDEDEDEVGGCGSGVSNGALAVHSNPSTRGLR